jgi:hypothetical protein
MQIYQLFAVQWPLSLLVVTPSQLLMTATQHILDSEVEVDLRLTVSQSVLVSDSHLEPMTRFLSSV